MTDTNSPKGENLQDNPTFRYFVWKVDFSQDNKDIKKQLDRQGRDGWELVTITKEDHNSNESICVFKRRN
jgi:hypothetical protein